MSKRKLYRDMGVILLFGMVAAGIFGMYMKREQNAWAYQFADALLAEVEEKYAGAEEKVIEELLSDGIQPPKESVLRKYGLEESTFSRKFQDNRMHLSIFEGIMGILFLVCIAELLLALRYSKEQKAELATMERYCEEILNNHYGLDLRDNAEGDFSILKNKVYDITVMLNEKNRALEKNKKETEQLLADISHQLKTPITSLNMINELLYMDLPEEKRIEFLDNMQKDLMRIEWFVKMILNLAKLDSKTLVLKKEQVNAESLSEEVKAYFLAFCEMHACEIEISCEPSVRVFCDKKWTKEAICNIVKNAVEHGAKTVRMSWEENYIYTKLEIADDGEGIEKEELPHIFERFYKTKNSREDSVGLGLAFCKSIVGHQDGELRVRSKKGEGTVFSFKFYKKLEKEVC